MTNPTPQFPGKPVQTGAAPKPQPWLQMMCPFLTAGELARQGPTTIVQLGSAGQAPKQVGMVSCLGPKCSLYMQMTAPDGSIAQQGCSPAMLVGLQLGLNQMVGTFIQAAEAGARAEAAERAAEEAAEAVKNAPSVPPASTETLPSPGAPAVPEPSPLTPAADAAEKKEAP